MPPGGEFKAQILALVARASCPCVSGDKPKAAVNSTIGQTGSINCILFFGSIYFNFVKFIGFLTIFQPCYKTVW
jgi:hypothetical protein